MKYTISLIAVSVFLAGSFVHANPLENILGTRLTRKAHRLAEKLEVSPFVLATDKDDECAVDQLHIFLKSWRHFSAEEKQSAIYASKAINSLSIARSRQSGTITGSRTLLSFVVCSQGRQDRCTTISKILGEKFVLNGSIPKTNISESAAGNVTLTTELLKDNHWSIHYIADTRSIYDRTNTLDSPEFSRSLANGDIRKGDDIVQDDTVCGGVPLKDLITVFTN